MKRPFGVTPAASFMRSRHLIAVNHRSDRAAFGLRGKTKPSRHNVLDSWKAFDPPCEGQSRTAFRTPSAQSRKSSMPSGFFSESSTPLTSMTTPQSGDQRPASQPTPSSRDQHNGSYFLLQRVPCLGRRVLTYIFIAKIRSKNRGCPDPAGRTPSIKCRLSKCSSMNAIRLNGCT